MQLRLQPIQNCDVADVSSVGQPDAYAATRSGSVAGIRSAVATVSMWLVSDSFHVIDSV
jgi:hypothetical protein